MRGFDSLGLEVESSMMARWRKVWYAEGIVAGGTRADAERYIPGYGETRNH